MNEVEDVGLEVCACEGKWEPGCDVCNKFGKEEEYGKTFSWNMTSRLVKIFCVARSNNL